MLQNSQRGDYVIIVHGLGRTWRSMKKPQKFLEKKGYCVLNFNYPSTKHTIETLSQDHLEKFIQTYCQDQRKKLHFLTHSMGGILVRTYLRHNTLGNLGRVVMLAPPNQGTEVVDWQKNWSIFKWMLGPAGQQLSTDNQSLPAQLGPVDFELGIIAGDRSFEFVHSLIIPGSDDGKVAVERTKIQGMKDFLVVHKTHTFIMRDTNVLQQAEHFFQTGMFRHST